MKIAAHCINPVLGHAVTIAFEVKEIVGDAEALASPGSDRKLIVPLVRLAPGIEFDADVQLGHGDNDGPRLNFFVAPSDDGCFGGWALEKVQPEGSEQDVQSSNREAGKQTSEESSAPADAELYGLISDDLSKLTATADPLHRAAILCEAAARLRPRLQAMPKFKGKPIIFVYDRSTGLGMWIINPAGSSVVAGRRIELGFDTSTGLMTVIVETATQ